MSSMARFNAQAGLSTEQQVSTTRYVVSNTLPGFLTSRVSLGHGPVPASGIAK